MDQVICRAIEGRNLLMFGYGDQVRVVEPHLYGINSAGHEALRAWLRPGLSRADPEGGWRMYLVPEMRSLQLLDERFAAPRPGYNPNDRHMQRIFCRLPGRAAGDDARDQSDAAGTADAGHSRDESSVGASSAGSEQGTRASPPDASH